MNNYPITWTLFTKRTNYPKLGYLIHRLKQAAIACRFGSDSFHAPTLWVDKEHESEAWAMLSERHGRVELDDVADDNKKFQPYCNENPTHNESGEPIDDPLKD